MKDIDFKILSELMKKSNISDRQLSKKLGVSQPTVTRRRLGLEKDGIIKEYTMIPDFTRIGYHLMAITMFKYDAEVGEQIRKAARQAAMKVVEEAPSEMIMAERGLGLGYDGVTISFHKNYHAYIRFRNWVSQRNPVKALRIESFLINLDDDIHFRHLTFSTLAKHLLEQEDTSSKKKHKD